MSLINKSDKDVIPSGPVPNTPMTADYVKSVASFAYVWGWPMVSMINRCVGLTSVSQPGLRGGVLPNAPIGHVCMMTDYIAPTQRFVACTNQDVIYGFGFGRVDEEPVIIQVPDFGDRFWVTAVWDHRTDSVAELGAQYGTKPGFYAVVGPNWKGSLPEGITNYFVSPTNLVALCPRVFMADTKEDREVIDSLVKKVNIYPLSEFTGSVQEYDWASVPSFPVPGQLGDSEIKWVDPTTFFDQLPDVLEAVPPLPGEETLYQQFRSILAAAKTDPEIKTALIEAATETEKAVITPLLKWKYNGPPAGNGWYSPKNNSNFGTDYITRTAIARSNMFENAPQETVYLFTDTDTNGKQLDGSNSYTVTFQSGQLPPVQGFWSLTLYNKEHFYYENKLKRYSLGTKNSDLVFNEDGSLTLYIGNNKPTNAPESNWLPSPSDNLSLYIRAYWPELSILDRTWEPPTITSNK